MGKCYLYRALPKYSLAIHLSSPHCITEYVTTIFQLKPNRWLKLGFVIIHGKYVFTFHNKLMVKEKMLFSPASSLQSKQDWGCEAENFFLQYISKFLIIVLVIKIIISKDTYYTTIDIELCNISLYST